MSIFELYRIDWHDCLMVYRRAQDKELKTSPDPLPGLEQKNSPTSLFEC